jgi:inner membrane protein
MKIEITNQGKWYESLTIKIGLLAFLGLVLLIPLQMIMFIISERQKNSEKVKQEISNQWAGNQCITGPVMNIPVKTIPTEKDEKSQSLIWHIMPEMLDVSGKIDPEIRYRSIYQSVVYKSDLQISGSFAIPAGSKPQNCEILWNDAYITFGVSDNRGLKGDVKLKTDLGEFQAEPGVRDKEISLSGISFKSPISDTVKNFGFSMDLSLSGSESIQFIPVGKKTAVKLNSAWKSPSFSGSFLPLNRNVDANGFSAGWEVTYLNRNFPQAWTGNAYSLKDNSFGLDLFLPVDHYQKSYRSARYGILFIALTFLVLIFLEITRKETIHIFHYFLVSLSLVLFFSLLNSLSEQTGFAPAYLISSLATIVMITLFTASIFRKKTAALAIFGMLAVLYLFIYILLTLNDYAYLAGNIGLFVLLAVVMWLATKMNILKKDPEAGTII